MIEKKLVATLIDTAEFAAVEAGKWIETQARDTIKKFVKSGMTTQSSQVVTEVDYGSEAIILKHLSPVIEPLGYGLLTEEKEDDNSRLTHPYFWAIDPLDGTLAYTAGASGYVVSIALVSVSGESILGVIYDPKNKNLYSAFRGCGVFKNRRPLTLRSSGDKQVSLLADFAAKNDAAVTAHLKDCKEKLAKHGYLFHADHMSGGAAINAIHIIERAPALYYKPPKQQRGGGAIWDFAASACILEECRAHVSAFDGSPLNLNVEHTVFMNEQGVVLASTRELANHWISEVNASNTTK